MVRSQRRRKTDKPRPASVAWLFAHAGQIVSVIILAGFIGAGMTHFATAADVEEKFQALQQQIRFAAKDAKRERLKSDKDRIEDKLRELRNSRNPRRVRPSILHYQSRLEDINERLRDLETNEK